MQETKFERAIRTALISEFEYMIPQADSHIFSPEFEKKMNKLICRQKKPYYSLINTFSKRAACFFVCIAIVSSVAVISIEATRNTTANFLINFFPDHSVVTRDDPDASPTLKDIYEITYDLSDFEIVFNHKSDTHYDISYKRNDTIVDFAQSSKYSYNVIWNTEDAVIEKVMLNDTEAIYFYNNLCLHNLIWENEDYVFSITTNLGKNELFEIAKSVQKVE